MILSYWVFVGNSAKINLEIPRFLNVFCSQEVDGHIATVTFTFDQFYP